MSTVERRVRPRARHGEPNRHLVTWSWLVLLALPLSFAAGFVAAYVPYAFTDWQETDPTPLWFALLVAVLAIGVTWIPVGVSGVLARRALFAGAHGRVGAPAGRHPADHRRRLLDRDQRLTDSSGTGARGEPSRLVPHRDGSRRVTK